MLIRCATNATSKDKQNKIKKEGDKLFLKKLTHLSLQNQNLVEIEEDSLITCQSL